MQRARRLLESATSEVPHMRRLWVGCILSSAFALSLVGCEDPGPKLDPRMKTFEEAQKSVKPIPKPAQTVVTTTPPDDGKTRISLHWTVQKDHPVALQARVGAGGSGTVDAEKLALGAALSHEELSKLLSSSGGAVAVTAALEATPYGELVLRARAESAPKDGKAPLASGVAALKDEGKIRANMNSRGFITTDLDRNLRNVLAVMFELPQDPVAVGEQWRSSIKLVSPSDAFIETHSQRSNLVRLVSVDKDAAGKQVAVIDYVIAENHVGSIGEDKDRQQATLASAFIGTGRFLVDEGRWESLTGRAVTLGTGALEGHTDESIQVDPAASVPPDLLQDPAPKQVQAQASDDDESAPTDGTVSAKKSVKPAKGKHR